MSTQFPTAEEIFKDEREAWLGMSEEDRQSLALQMKQGEAYVLSCPGPSHAARAIMDRDSPMLDCRYVALPTSFEEILRAAPPTGYDRLLERIEKRDITDYAKLAAKGIVPTRTDAGNGQVRVTLMRQRWMLFQWVPHVEPGLRSYISISIAEDARTLAPIGDGGGVPLGWLEQAINASTYHLRNEATEGKWTDHLMKAAASRREQQCRNRALEFQQQQYRGFETAKYATEAVKQGKHERIFVGAGD